MILYRLINIINHATRVIDVFFAGRVGRQKGLRMSAWVSRLNMKLRDRCVSSDHRQQV
jgi:hypothetical protein